MSQVTLLSVAVSLPNALLAHAAPAPQPAPLSPCTWIQDTDYRGVNNTAWRVGSDMTQEGCCELCQQTSGCDFTVWNPSAKSCWFKTNGAVPFHKPGDVSCCPRGSKACPEAPADGWTLLTEFSDEFPVDASHGALLPLNLSKWNISPTSSSPGWSWAADNVEVVSSLPPAPMSASVGLGEVQGSYLALTASYDEHDCGGAKCFYKSGIAKSTIPAGISFGRFEAKIRGASRWPGVTPMFQVCRQSKDHGEYSMELDVVTLGGDPESAQTMTSAWHVFPPTMGIGKAIGESDDVKLAFDPRDDFHIYAMEWNTSSLTWSVDDHVVKQVRSAPFFDQGWALDVALSLGLTSPLIESPSSDGFPTTFYVDWVRVWQMNQAHSIVA